MTPRRLAVLFLAAAVSAAGCQKSEPPAPPADPPPAAKAPAGKRSRAAAPPPETPASAKLDRVGSNSDLMAFVERSKIPKDVVSAWVEAGAYPMWFGLHARHKDFRTDSDPTQLADPLPAFYPSRNEFAGKLGGLPTPPVPFAFRAEREFSTDYALRGLGKHQTLAALDLNRSQMTAETLTGIGGLTNLKYLDLSGADVTDAGMKPVGNLTALTTLNLWDTRITDAGLAHLKGLTNLTWLDLRAGGLTRPGPVVAGFTKVQVLRIGRPGANAETARAIGTHLKAIRELDFFYDRDRPEKDTLAAFKDMTSLERLVLDADFQVKDAELFRGLTRLRHLEFPGFHLDEERVKALKATLPNCKLVGPGGRELPSK